MLRKSSTLGGAIKVGCAALVLSAVSLEAVNSLENRGVDIFFDPSDSSKAVSEITSIVALASGYVVKQQGANRNIYVQPIFGGDGLPPHEPVTTREEIAAITSEYAGNIWAVILGVFGYAFVKFREEEGAEEIVKKRAE